MWNSHTRHRSVIQRGKGWLMMIMFIMTTSTYWLPVANATTIPTVNLEPRAKVSFAHGVELRVLPIGDSITQGTSWSSDKGGYRSRLYSLMTKQWSNQIHFVGSRYHGNFSQNHHEGHPGYKIKQIQSSSQVGIYQSPNIVLLHAGTNDMAKTNGTAAPSDLITLIDSILKISTNTTIFVCKIIPIKNTTMAAKLSKYNDQIVKTVLPRYKNKKVFLVDMFTGFDTKNLRDNAHPNDVGYQDMAGRWFKALAAHESYIVKPGTARKPPVAKRVVV